MLKKKLINIADAVQHLRSVIDTQEVTFALISDAPAWLRLLSRGTYCAYGTTVYAPEFHLSLVSSKSDVDRTLATAKILPHVMLIKDFKTVSALTFLKSRFLNSYIFHYFLYEFLFLKVTEHKMIDTITIGFIVSRRNWYGKKLSFDEVQNELVKITTASQV